MIAVIQRGCVNMSNGAREADVSTRIAEHSYAAVPPMCILFLRAQKERERDGMRSIGRGEGKGC